MWTSTGNLQGMQSATENWDLVGIIGSTRRGGERQILHEIQDSSVVVGCSPRMFSAMLAAILAAASFT